MPINYRAITAAAARILLAFSVLSLPALAGPMPQLVGELETWIDANTNLPPAPAPANIRITDDYTDDAKHVASMAIGLRTRGLYEPETATITLVRPWNGANTVDVSVLLHELVHHRQEGIFYQCLGARELVAYKLQQDWLAETNLALDINWFAVVLASGCTPRDVHPD